MKNIFYRLGAGGNRGTDGAHEEGMVLMCIDYALARLEMKDE